MIAFIAGFAVGTIAGVFAMALACMAGRSDRITERMFREALNDVNFDNVD